MLRNRSGGPLGRGRLRLILSSFYAVQFGHLGIVLPFLAPWFLGRGFGPTSIGVLMALPPLCKILAPWSWGRWADRSGKRRELLAVAAALAAVALATMAFVHAPVWIFTLVAVYGFARSPLIPYAEATSLEQSELRRFDYGPVRVWGSLAFAGVAAGFGVAEASLSLDAGLLIGAGFLGAAALIALWFPRPLAMGMAGETDSESDASAGVARATEGGLVRFFAACALMQVSHGAYYTFFSIHVQELGYGGAVIGWLWALAVVCEIVMLTFVDRVVDRYGSGPVLRLSLTLAVVRWVMVGTLSSLSWLAMAQTLHAFTYAAFHVGAIRVVHRRFPHARARGQALYSGMTYGLGMFVGSLAAGALALPLGLQGLFLASAGVAVLALFVLPVRSPGLIDPGGNREDALRHVGTVRE